VPANFRNIISMQPMRSCVMECPLVMGGGAQSKQFPSSRHVPQRVSISTSLLSHMFLQMLFSFHLYSWAKGGTQHFKIEPFILGASIVSFFQSDGSQIGSWGRERGATWCFLVPNVFPSS
jgi:hypothetical protein